MSYPTPDCTSIDHEQLEAFHTAVLYEKTEEIEKFLNPANIQENPQLYQKLLVTRDERHSYLWNSLQAACFNSRMKVSTLQYLFDMANEIDHRLQNLGETNRSSSCGSTSTIRGMLLAKGNENLTALDRAVECELNAECFGLLLKYIEQTLTTRPNEIQHYLDNITICPEEGEHKKFKHPPSILHLAAIQSLPAASFRLLLSFCERHFSSYDDNRDGTKSVKSLLLRRGEPDVFCRRTILHEIVKHRNTSYETIQCLLAACARHLIGTEFQSFIAMQELEPDNVARDKWSEHDSIFNSLVHEFRDEHKLLVVSAHVESERTFVKMMKTENKYGMSPLAQFLLGMNDWATSILENEGNKHRLPNYQDDDDSDRPHQNVGNFWKLSRKLYRDRFGGLFPPNGRMTMTDVDDVMEVAAGKEKDCVIQ